MATCLLVVAVSAQAKPGQLDPSFGSGGKVTTELKAGAKDEEIDGLALQPNGGIVAAGYTWDGTQDDYAIARYKPSGALDPSFGSGGKVVLSSPKEEWYNGVAVQPDGKIVAVGRATLGGKAAFGITRFNPNGSLDKSFGSGGQVQQQFGGMYGNAYRVLVLPDGKIVVCGYAGNTAKRGFALVRYTSAGALDTSFGTGGVVKTYFGTDGGAYDLALQPDGKIVAVGYGLLGTGKYGFAVARYNADGSLDTSFGSGGKATADLGDEHFSYAYRVALQSDGKIVAAGRAYNAASLADMAVARFTPAGKLDPSFGTGGKVVTVFGTSYDSAESVLVQRNRKIVLVGYMRNPASHYEFAAARYLPNGALDSTFGTGGKVVTPVHGHDDYGLDGVLQPDGKIVGGGAADLSTDYSNYAFALVRYQGDACKVPKLKGKKLGKARRLLVRHTCKVGKVKKRFSTSVKKGRVLAQKPGAGTQVASATPVNLVVSKGSRH